MTNLAIHFLLFPFLLIALSGCCSLNTDELISKFVEESKDSIWFKDCETNGILRAAYHFSEDGITVYLANCSDSDLIVNMSEGTYCYAVKYKTRKGEVDYHMSPLVMGLNSMSNLVILWKIPKNDPRTAFDHKSSISFTINMPNDCVEIIAVSVSVTYLNVCDLHFNSAEELSKAFLENERKILAHDLGKGNMK